MKSSNKGVDNKVLKSSTTQSSSGYYSSSEMGSGGTFSSSVVENAQKRMDKIKQENQKSAQNAEKSGSSGTLS